MHQTSTAHEFAVQKANEYIQHTPRSDAYRQVYHITPPVGWMNDPNGLVYFQGEYHVFYQYHPYSAQWGPMHWGHVKSKDLVTWERLPVALAPSEWYDKDGCFSGSAVDHDGVLTLIYTGNIGSDNPRQVQCIATSTDGVTFAKSPANPVIPSSPPDAVAKDFRDPKVWHHGGQWWMVVGAGTNVGKALLYRSENLQDWVYVGVLAESDGTQGQMWECPDFIELDGKSALIVSPIGMEGHKNICITGHMDYERGRFTQGLYHELDHGHDFYAAQTFLAPDGRRILLGWMNHWREPNVTEAFGWSGSLTLPRELVWLPNGRLGMRPVKELEKLRLSHQSFAGSYANGCHALEPGISLEICLTVDLAASTASAFGLKLRCAGDGQQVTLVQYRVADQRLTVDRAKSGIPLYGDTSTAVVQSADGLLKIHVFLDTSSIEVFVNDGLLCMSNRIYPDPSSQGTFFFVEGGHAEVRTLDVWRLGQARADI